MKKYIRVTSSMRCVLCAGFESDDKCLEVSLAASKQTPPLGACIGHNIYLEVKDNEAVNKDR